MAIRVLTLFFTLFLLTSCYYQKLEDEKNTGKVNKVKRGDKFRVSLPEDHKTRFLWALKKDIPTTIVQYTGSVFHGTYVDFNFEAVGPGTQELDLILYSAKDTTDRKTFVVSVE